MIFKAIVASVISDPERDNDKIYVTIPILDGSSSKSDFKGVNKRLATICSLPGCIPKYAEGDVVYVDFEQDNMSQPIIIGSLMSSKSNTSVIDLYADSLTVDVNTQLSGETIIEGNQLTMEQSASTGGGNGGGSSGGDSGGGDDLHITVDDVEGAQPTITAVGILKGRGNGVISPAVIDTAPTNNSINLVSSGGVYTALANFIIADNLISNCHYGTEDLEAGVTPLNEGEIYLCYE